MRNLDNKKAQTLDGEGFDVVKYIRKLTMNSIVQSLNPTQERSLDFKVRGVEFEFECVIQKLTEMGTLFALIEKLMAEDTFASRVQVKSLASLGHYSCDDWTDNLECAKDNLLKDFGLAAQ